MVQVGSDSQVAVGVDSSGASSDVKPVVARSLVKEFGDLVAVRGIDFEVRPGECFGFLGPNGAGKTSTMRMITCASPVTSGSLLVNGLSVQTQGRAVKSIIGVVPQGDNLDDEISVINNLRLYAGYFGISRTEADARAKTALELFQLAERADSPVDELSGGMKRRLLIARGLINEPEILVLDEPTTGLDPQARHLVWRTLRRLKDQGVTMLLTTHYMDEAATLCDRLIVMHEGRILAEGTPPELILRIAGETVIEAHSLDVGALDRIAEHLRDAGAEIEQTPDTVHAFGLNGSDVAESNVPGAQIYSRPANLEDVFLRLTGRSLEE
ncbi:MAG: ABC transporter ATP-binding protein [Dehalococcoidia bacterium]|nr:ABC transporter ATP-binding protein [Dehalococcoidia bacterium]